MSDPEPHPPLPDCEAAALARLRLLAATVQVCLMDFDGVIADTERLQVVAYQRLFDACGIAFDPKDFGRHMGRTEAQILDTVLSGAGSPVDVPTAAARRREILLELIDQEGLAPNWFVAPLLSLFAATGREVYVVSANTRAMIVTLLDRWGLTHQFAGVETLADTSDVVDKPQLFLRLISRLALRPTEVLVIEDSRQMLQTGRAIGLHTVGVRHALNRNERLDAELVLEVFGSRAVGG